MITNVTTLSEAFVKFLEDIDIATFGQDLYIGEVPSSLDSQDPAYWILTSGGAPVNKLKTGEIVRLHAITIYFRSMSGQEVEKKLFDLGELIQTPECIQLQGFETIDVSVSQFPATSDLDVEGRKTGLLRINIQTYKRSA